MDGCMYVSLTLTYLTHTHTHTHLHTDYTLHGNGISFSLEGYATYAHTHTDDLPLYVFDSRFVDKCAGMGEDYIPYLPPYFQHVAGCRGDTRCPLLLKSIALYFSRSETKTWRNFK